MALYGLLLREDRRQPDERREPGRHRRARRHAALHAAPADHRPAARATSRIHDELDALNATAVFAPGTLALVRVSRRAPTSATRIANGGTNGAGVLDIRNLSLPVGSQVLIQFDVTLAAALSNGTVVTNQSQLCSRTARRSPPATIPTSTARPIQTCRGDEDPTRVQIASAACFRRAEDLDRPDGRSDRPARRRDAALHDHGQEHRHRQRDGRRAARRSAREHDLRRGQHDAERHGGRRTPAAFRRSCNGMPIHAPEIRRRASMRADASADADQRRDDHLRRRRRPERHRRHGDLEPGLRQRRRRAASPTSRPTIRDTPTRERPDARRGRQPAAPVRARSAPCCPVDHGSPGIVDPGDVLRYTITVLQHRRRPGDRRRAADSVPANTTYVADSTDAERPARRAAGRRRFAARWPASTSAPPI